MKDHTHQTKLNELQNQEKGENERKVGTASSTTNH